MEASKVGAKLCWRKGCLWLCVCAVLPLQCWGVWSFWGWEACVCVPMPCVFPTFLHVPAYMFVCFPLLAVVSLISVCLASMGQLINQIFKQCSSAQWVVPDYSWMLAVRGPVTLHASSWTGIATEGALFPLSLLLTRGCLHSFPHSVFLFRTLCRSLDPSLVFLVCCYSHSLYV